jgi:hypothetical protein
VCSGRSRAQGKRRKKFETITEVWKIAPSKQRIALRTPSQQMEYAFQGREPLRGVLLPDFLLPHPRVLVRSAAGHEADPALL